MGMSPEGGARLVEADVSVTPQPKQLNILRALGEHFRIPHAFDGKILGDAGGDVRPREVDIDM